MGAAQQALAIDEPKKRGAIFAHERILALTDLLVDNGFDDLEDIGLLLLGLPPEMLATLPQPSDALGRLAECLAALNRMTFAVGDHVPIYYVLINAANRLRWNRFRHGDRSLQARGRGRAVSPRSGRSSKRFPLRSSADFLRAA